MRGTGAVAGTLRMARAPKIATERIRVWIDRIQVLLSAVFPVLEEIILVLYSVDEKINVVWKNRDPAV